MSGHTENKSDLSERVWLFRSLLQQLIEAPELEDRVSVYTARVMHRAREALADETVTGETP